MAFIVSRQASLVPYLKTHIELLLEQRRRLGQGQRRSRVGINYSLVIATACLVEGVLEASLKELVSDRHRVLNQIQEADFHKRRIKNCFAENIDDYLRRKIERTTGIDKYAPILKLLSHQRRPPQLKNFKNWEGLKVLFNLRNALAHGREISGSKVRAFYLGDDWIDEFVGSYRVVEDYAIKKKLIKSKFLDKGTLEHILTNAVTDHCRSVAKEFLRYIRPIFRKEMEELEFDDFLSL